MSLELQGNPSLKQSPVHKAFFKNEEGKEGFFEWLPPFASGDTWKVTTWGQNIGGFTVYAETIEMDAQDTINPSKVAKAILKALANALNSNDAT